MAINPGFIANRIDRLGARLIPIANAYFLSERYGTKFSFEWSRTHIADPPTAVLSDQFVKKHFSESPLAGKNLTSHRSHRDICNIIAKYKFVDTNSNDLLKVNDPLGIYVEEYDNPEHIRKHISKLFMRDILSDELKRVFDRVHKSLGDHYSALHLRRGDLVELFSESEHYSDIVFRYVPLEVAGIAKERSENLLVFTDSADALGDELKEFSIDRRVQSGLLSNLTESQRDLLELLLIGRSQKIYSGRSSFSSCASALGGVEIEHPIFTLGVAKYFDTILFGRDIFFGSFSRDQTIAALDTAASILSQSLRHTEAAEAAQYFVTHFPDCARSYFRSGHVAMHRRDYSEASEFFKRAIMVESTAEAYHGLARSLDVQRQVAERDLALSEGIRRFPGDQQLEDLKGRYWT